MCLFLIFIYFLPVLWTELFASSEYIFLFVYFFGLNIMFSTMFQPCQATSGLSILLYGIISLPDMTSYDNYFYEILLMLFSRG